MDFIDDKALLVKINNALKYSAWLILSQKDNPNKSIKEETYRVIILYVVSILEAILMFLYDKRSEKIEREIFRQTTPIRDCFQNPTSKGTIVIAVKDTEVVTNNIGMKDLVNHFKKYSVLEPKIADKILKINDIRNTHHLTKKRNENCTINDVEEALDVLNEILNKKSLHLV